MSKRPLGRKRANRVRKALRGELPRYLDLVQWLKDHCYANTTGEAEKIILDGRVKSESHTLGVTTQTIATALTDAQKASGAVSDFTEQKAVNRYVPAHLRSTIRVSD